MGCPAIELVLRMVADGHQTSSNLQWLDWSDTRLARMVLIAAYELAADAFEQSLLLSPFQIQSQIRISNRAYFLSNCQCFLFSV